MKRILSFGGGLQTTALAILVAQGKVQVDEAVFSDVGAEKPETYWYIENYIKPLFAEINIPFHMIPGVDPTRRPENRMNLVEHCYHYKAIPAIKPRWCTPQFKTRPINKFVGNGHIQLIGFSVDELRRAENAREYREFPLIERNISSGDCSRIITDYGWPIPIKSSCFFCPFQRPTEWNWLKGRHPELLDKAVQMEARFYEKRPDMRETKGLLAGKPLWKWVEGIQMEMPVLEEYSCWSGYCSH